MIRPRFKAIALLPFTVLVSGVPHAQDETATYTITFEGLWTADDITDASLPIGAHFTQVIGATHNSSTTLWAPGGMASAGVEDVAELGIVTDLVREIGQNTDADVTVRAGSFFNSPTQTVSGTFTATASHPLVSVLSMIAPSPDWFVGVSSLSLYDNGWRNRVVDLYPYDAGTEQGSGWSLSNAATVPQGVIASIRNTGRFRDNPIARLSFTSEQATDEEEGAASPETHTADYTVPLLVPPGTSGGPQGMLRILNGTDESGTVEIYAVDDAGTRTGPATFTLNASAAAEFTATDLQSGNASLGLTGGIGADSNEEASGANYKKIPRELTLMLQEALLRDAVKFEYDPILRSEVGVAVVDGQGEELVDLRKEWLPREIYGEEDYTDRVMDLRRRRYYGRDSQDKAGILRYTKVNSALIDLADIPAPADERELTWLLSFFWQVDQAYNSLSDLMEHIGEGQRPLTHLLRELQDKYETSVSLGLQLSERGKLALPRLGLT